MNLEYVPLLRLQRELHELPRNRARFAQYLRTIVNPDGTVELPSLVAMNPMGREHVTQLLDEYLALDGESVARAAVAEAGAALAAEPGNVKVGVVIADDLKGGWTNRYANEFTYRFPAGSMTEKPRWLKHAWVTAVLWSSEPATAEAVREAVLTALYRLAYLRRHGQARTLRQMLVQEGVVLARSRCRGPTLDPDDLDYTRGVLEPLLDRPADMPTAIQSLFGDAAGATLGFAPMGLSPWAGLALALHDAASSCECPASRTP